MGGEANKGCTKNGRFLSNYYYSRLILLMDYHIQLSWGIFVLAGTVSILVAVITVSFNGVKSAIANPVQSLRTE